MPNVTALNGQEISQIIESIVNIVPVLHQNRCNRLKHRIKMGREGISEVFSAANLHTETELRKFYFLALKICLEDAFALLSRYSSTDVDRIIKHGTDCGEFRRVNETYVRSMKTLGIDTGDTTIWKKEDSEDFKSDANTLKKDLKELLLASKFASATDFKIAMQNTGDLIDAQMEAWDLPGPREVMVQDYMISPKRLEFGQIIGQGGFGTVYAGKFDGETPVAIKKLNTTGLHSNALASFKDEAEIMQRLNHPRIVSFYGIAQLEDGSPCMIMEFMAGGNLANFISAHPPILFRLQLQIATDIAEGMKFLSRIRVLHRDLKCSNIVLDDNLRAKVTDFGLSVTRTETTTLVNRGEAGTVHYMAPECFGLQPEFSFKSDVYAFAVILWELAEWKSAYKGVVKQEVISLISKGSRLPLPKHPFAPLIQRGWSQNTVTRPTFQDMVNLLDKMHNSNHVNPDVSRKVSVMSPSLNNTTNSPSALIGSFTAQHAPPPPVPSLQKFATKSEITPKKKSKLANYKLPKLQLVKISKREMYIFAGILFILAAVGLGVGLYVALSGKSSHQSSTSTPTFRPRGNLTVSTYAGNGISGVVDAQSMYASFDEPYGILVDSNDNVFVSDANGCTIRKIDTSGVVTTVAGIPASCGLTDGSARSSLFYTPMGMCFRTDGSLIVADRDNHAIRAISSDLQTVKTVAGNGTAGYFNAADGTKALFYWPSGVACDDNGNIYVADTGNSMIRKIDSQNAVSHVGGVLNSYSRSNGKLDTKATFCLPRSLLYNPTTSTIYQADGCDNGLIREINIQAGIITTVAGDSSAYQSDYLDGPVLSAIFSRIQGMALDKAGNIYLSEYSEDSYHNYNHIRLINMTTKVVSTISGFNDTCGLTNGLPKNATFCGPRSMGFDSLGSLYIADLNNYVIRKIGYY